MSAFRLDWDAMNYLIHNAVRDCHNRTLRASKPTHRGMKQFLFKSQDRLVRGRPILVTEEKLLANIDEIKSKVRDGLVYVTLGNLTPFDVERFVPATTPKTKSPEFPLDSINRDRHVGLPMNQYADKPAPENFVMPVPPPDAALESPLPGLSEDVSDAATQSLDTEAKPGDHQRRKHRR